MSCLQHWANNKNIRWLKIRKCALPHLIFFCQTLQWNKLNGFIELISTASEKCFIIIYCCKPEFSHNSESVWCTCNNFYLGIEMNTTGWLAILRRSFGTIPNNLCLLKSSLVMVSDIVLLACLYLNKLFNEKVYFWKDIRCPLCVWKTLFLLVSSFCSSAG